MYVERVGTEPETMRRETYLVVRDRETMQVVTVIELLSPSNKRRNGDGRREYLTKREEFLSSSTHLVELDFLRGGLRLPVIGASAWRLLRDHQPCKSSATL